MTAIAARAVNPLSVTVAPLSRAGGYYARAWRRYLVRRPVTGVPVVRPTLALGGQAFLDEVLLAGFRAVHPVSHADVPAIEAETEAAAELYEHSGWTDDPLRFHAEPPALSRVTISPGHARRQRYERLSFESGYEPHPGEPGRDRWLGFAANRQACAWMLRHDEPRPWLVAVHGARMGRASIDLAIMRARWLHEELGLNVVFPVLPLHGPRLGSTPASTFPGERVVDNIHGAAQAVWDIRRLISWVRSQDASAPIGLTGVSLGGYITSLVASVEDGLACAIVGVPVVDLVDLIEYHAGLEADDERRRVIVLAKRAGRVVSPLALTPCVPQEGRFIYAGLADRLVHPRRQVVHLWEHWGRPQIAWYEGSHIGFFRSKPVGRFVRQALEQSGLVAAELLL